LAESSPRRRLRDAFRDDPVLAAATATLTLFTLAPLAVTPFVPLHDLPDNIALAALMDDALTPGTVAAEHYRVQPLLVPYTAFYALAAVMVAIFGVVLGTKLTVAVIVLLLPLGLMKLCLTLGRDPRLGLAGFGLAWGHNTIWGFVAYKMGLGLVPFALAALASSTTPKEALRRSAPTALLALTHAQAFGLFGLLGFWLVGRDARPRRRPLIYLAHVAPGVLLLLPWFIARITGGGDGLQPGQKLVEWHAFADQLSRAAAYSTRSLPGPLAEQGGETVFWALLLLPSLAVLRWRTARDDRHVLPLLLVFATTVLLYFFTPMAIGWPFSQWYIYPRFAVAVLAFACVVPPGRYRGWWALALAPAVVAIAVLNAGVTRQFWDFGTRARHFIPIMEAVSDEPRMITLTLHDSDPAVPLDPYNQFHAYVVAARGGFDPFLFDNPNVPIVYRKETKLPHPPWYQTVRTRLDQHVRHYDHVLVQGKERDPLPRQRLPKDMRLITVTESGRWRLYQVEIEDDPPPTGGDDTPSD
jgi:hypothetical protein